MNFEIKHTAVEPTFICETQQGKYVNYTEQKLLVEVDKLIVESIVRPFVDRALFGVEFTQTPSLQLLAGIMQAALGERKVDPQSLSEVSIFIRGKDIKLSVMETYVDGKKAIIRRPWAIEFIDAPRSCFVKTVEV